MSNSAISQAIERLSKATDPKMAIINEIGQDVINAYDVMEDDVLIGTYIRPERTKGGIILTDRMKEEDRFQGKVGLVLKMGPSAFKYDRSGQFPFEGNRPEIHAWAVYRASDAWEVAIKGVSCRLVRSALIRGFVDDPAVIW